jgi:predicted DNA-binding transcriptional regulator AlpA
MTVESQLQKAADPLTPDPLTAIPKVAGLPLQTVLDPLMTIPEVAERLRKSEAQIRWMRHNGTGPRSAKISGRVMFRSSDVEDYIAKAFEDGAA